MELIRSVIKCSYCTRTLEKPVVLPCGELICEKHMNDEKSIQCSSCDQVHELTEKLYPVKAMEKLLEVHLDKLDLGPEYQKAYRSCLDLEISLAEFDQLCNDAELFIDRAINPLRNSVINKAQELSFEIEKRKTELLTQLDLYQQECELSLKETDFEFTFSRIGEKMEKRKIDLADRFKEIETSLEINQDKWEQMRNENQKVREQTEKDMSAFIASGLLMGKSREFQEKVNHFNSFSLK